MYTWARALTTARSDWLLNYDPRIDHHQNDGKDAQSHQQPIFNTFQHGNSRAVEPCPPALSGDSQPPDTYPGTA